MKCILIEIEVNYTVLFFLQFQYSRKFENKISIILQMVRDRAKQTKKLHHMHLQWFESLTSISTYFKSVIHFHCPAKNAGYIFIAILPICTYTLYVSVVHVRKIEAIATRNDFVLHNREHKAFINDLFYDYIDIEFVSSVTNINEIVNIIII